MAAAVTADNAASMLPRHSNQAISRRLDRSLRDGRGRMRWRYEQIC